MDESALDALSVALKRRGYGEAKPALLDETSDDNLPSGSRIHVHRSGPSYLSITMPRPGLRGLDVFSVVLFLVLIGAGIGLAFWSPSWWLWSVLKWVLYTGVAALTLGGTLMLKEEVWDRPTLTFDNGMFRATGLRRPKESTHLEYEVPTAEIDGFDIHTFVDSQKGCVVKRGASRDFFGIGISSDEQAWLMYCLNRQCAPPGDDKRRLPTRQNAERRLP